jgi:hypothetical protein
MNEDNFVSSIREHRVWVKGSTSPRTNSYRNCTSPRTNSDRNTTTSTRSSPHHRHLDNILFERLHDASARSSEEYYVNSILHKSHLLDIEEDDDTIDSDPHLDNAFDELLSEGFTPITNVDDILDQIQIGGSASMQDDIRNLVTKYSTRFVSSVNEEPARVEPFELKVDKEKWESSRSNKAPPRQQSYDKEAEIARFVQEALKIGIIDKCQTTNWSQVHLTKSLTVNGGSVLIFER